MPLRPLAAEGSAFEGVWAELARFYASRPVLIAGADGFLGSACTNVLLALGARLTLAGRRACAGGHAGSRRFEGDLRDAEFARSTVAGQSIVIDCVGAAGALASNERPEESLMAECLPHLNLFRACAEADPRPTLVFLSSRLVYGRPKYLPVDEAHPLQVRSFYATHKISAENYLAVLEHTHGLPYVVLRISNPYGPHVPTPGRDYGVVNRFISDALLGRPIKVYGNGEQLRDYIHVDDAVLAMLMSAMTEACHGETFNLGGPDAISLRDAVSVIVETSPTHAPVEFVPWPSEALRVETGDYWTDNSKLRSFVPLPPQLGFREGVRRTMQRLAELQ